MARTEASLKHFMLTQQLKNEYWDGWDSDEERNALDSARNGDIKSLIICVLNRLWSKAIYVSEIYAIIHKGDIRACDSSEKVDHVHIVVKVRLGISTLTNIANAIGVEKAYIEKPKQGKYSYDNMLSYLIHIKDEEKTQHDPSEVVCIGVSDDNTQYGEQFCQAYTAIHEERCEAWLKGRAKKKTEKAKLNVDWLEEEILQGRMNMEQIMLTDELYDIYSRNKRRCDDALDTYGMRRAYRTIRDLKNGDMRIVTFFIQGESKAGKTTFAKGLAYRIIEYARANGLGDWEMADAASTNSFDDYHGEEILFMDDSRGVSLGASDWLRLLDENNISRGSARFHNRMMACRVIIITSTMAPAQFFGTLKNDTKSLGIGMTEAMNQFLRRIMANIICYRYGENDRRVCIETPYETTEYFVNPGIDNRRASFDFKSDDSELENLLPEAAIEILAQTAVYANKLDGLNINPYQKKGQ